MLPEHSPGSVKGDPAHNTHLGFDAILALELQEQLFPSAEMEFQHITVSSCECIASCMSTSTAT